MFASMNYEKLLKNPRDSFLIAEGYTLSPSTLLSHLFVLELALRKVAKKAITACGKA